MSAEFVLRGEGLLLGSTMCDACGEKVARFVGKKVCQKCHSHFCHKCVSSAPSFSKSHHICKVCSLMEQDVIERSHLNNLALVDLKYYTRRKNIAVPIAVEKDQIIVFILARQAKELKERARKALSQVAEDSADGVNVDLSRFEPHLSAYSMTFEREVKMEAGGDVSITPTLSGGGEQGNESYMGTSASASSRKRSREDIDYSMVTSLEVLTDESQISELSVKQLKLILQKNCINYKGCVEKRELLEKVVRLWQSRKEEKIRQATIAQTGDTSMESEYLCKVCMDSPVDCVLLECGHMLTCVKCGRQLAECPVCRQYVTRVVHAFRV